MVADVCRQSVLRVIDMPFEAGHPHAPGGTALHLLFNSLRVQHGAAVCDADVIQDVVLAGLEVELDFDKGTRESRNDTISFEIVLRNANQSTARKILHGPLGNLVNIFRVRLAAVGAAELYRSRIG